MPVADIKTWLDFAIQQMAAEAYLDQFTIQGRELRLVLRDGNNDIRKVGEDQFAGQTRFVDLVGVPTASQITGSGQAFAARYQIVDHHANDATGFSATLMRDTTTGEYTLSFRSTEFRDESLGGDHDRDAVKADGDIAVHGFAFAQLLAMEEYFARLKQGITSDGTFDAGLQAFFGNPTHQLNVTGYSLGGHLATVFTELHESEVRQTYLFNASGRGSLPGAVPGLAAEEQRIADMLAYFRRVIDNPDEALPSIVRGQNYQDAVTAWTNDPTWDPFDQGTATLYGDPRYQWARAATLDAFDPIGTSTIEIATGFQGEPQTTGAFAKMTALYGQAVSGDLEVVANSGIHRAGQAVLIEGQPLLANALGILPFGGQVDFGNTHAITLLVDSLSLQELFLTLDPQLQQTQIEALIRSSSNAKSDLVALTTASHAAEGDSLEKALEGLRKLFQPSPLTPATLNFDDAPGGFSNLTNRNDYYAAIAAVKTGLAGATVTIEPFVELNAQGNVVIRLAPSEVKVAAEEDSDRGLAFRYALKALNPFAVIGADYQGFGHASNGVLALFDPATGFGELTDQYLIDRAAFLEEKIELNLLNDAKSSGNIHFKDFTPNGLEIMTVLDLRVDQEFLFGSDGDEGIGVLVGGSKSDHLYGGGGSDLLEGGDGRDYLQGDAGIDRLDGGIGADTMVGGADSDFYLVDNLGDEVIEGFNNGTDRVESSVSFTLGANVEHLTLTGTTDLNGTGNNLNNDITGNSGINRLDGKGGTDHLIGGIGNDILIGGTGDNDLLEGGAGFDTYYYNNGDGIDQIEDSDARGKIVFNGGLLQGGISTDGGATYDSLDGAETYVISGGHLIVNGVLTVNADFQSGQFGIELMDLSTYPTDTGVPTGPFAFIEFGGESTDHFFVSSPYGPEELYGNGGDDALNGIGFSFDFNDLLDGGSGDDWLHGGLGHDYLIGGEGADFGWLTDGDIFVGGEGNDMAIGDTTISNFVVTNIGTGAHYADGGDGDDVLLGALGVDVLHGGDGNDRLRGENRPEGWIARLFGFDGFFHDYSMAAYFSPTGAADVLFGEAGNDILVGDGGDDILSGGADNDQLFGDDFAVDQAGYLVVPGDDVLDGGAGDDLLAAGDGNDSLSGGSGIDTLFGDKGDDVLDGGDGADTMRGGDGADNLFGGAGNDLLFGDGLNNQFVAGTAGGADFLDGGDGDDELQGGVGTDTLFGGAGNDFLLGQDDDDTLFGNEGDDELQGGAGNDLLGGDTGNDLLLGDAGDDTLFGGDGNDAIAGNDGNDSLFGGLGNDMLQGDQGNDVLVGGAGYDIYNFSLGDGQDTITDTALAGEGNIINFSPGITLGSLTFFQDQTQQTLTIQVAGGDFLRLLGFDPNTFNNVVDTLAFADGTVVALADQLPLPGGLIEGTDDSNVIRTGSGDDTIFAGAGNDFVNAGAGNDTLIGGTGNDVLTGGTGRDTHVFNSGDGLDTIADAAGEGNRILFGGGLSSSAVTLGRGNNGSLEIRGQLPGDRLQVLGGLVPGASPIETFEFADGTIQTFDQLIARGIDISGTSGPDTITGTSFIDRITGGAGNDVLFAEAGADQVFGGDGDDVIRGGEDNDVLNGEAGNDSLEGEAGNDALAGGAGDDQLLGGAGNDTYQFNLGDGIDSISDSIDVAEPNRVVFGTGITSSSITLTTDFSQILVRPGSSFEGVTIGANGSDALGFHAVDLFQFEDGTSLTYADLVARGFDIDGTEFDDFLFGTNVIDRFRGGRGHDRLEGGEGNDSYVFSLGDGVDTIVDAAAAGAGNEVVFGAGIASSDLRLDLTPDQSDSSLSDLFIRVGASGDAMQLDTFDRNNVFGSRTVETFRFADGSMLTYDQLLERGFDLTGTAGDDQLNGTNITDRMVAGDGADVLRSGAGNDTLDGGFGDDRLVGGQGNDTYVFGQGSGQDTIVESQGNLDTIRLAPAVAPSDVVVTRNNNDLVLSLNGGGDRLTVSLYFLAPPLQIELVQFADGTVWDQAFLEDLTQPALFGTGGSDSIMGTNGDDHLAGLAGDDQLTGLDGNDLLDGGTGTDQLTGGAGDDTYIVDDVGDVVTELANDGTDTIQSAVTRTLDANVERLTLTGAVAINGTGNTLNNILTGNSAANVLSGGAGNDTYVVGAGDAVVELAGEGTDTVQTGVSATLGANVENLTLTGSASITGIGNDMDNVLQADGSISILAGGDGNDTYVIGPNGDDDILVETAIGGIDTVIAAHDYRLPANIENLTLLDPLVPDFETFSLIPYGSSGLLVAGYGNDQDNLLTGGRANNVLDGGLGVDTMIGGEGDDTYVVDHIDDRVTEMPGEGIDTVLSSVSHTLDAHVEHLRLTGTEAIDGIGNNLDNQLLGNDASNVLDGGAGNDILNGAEGADTFMFGLGSGQDTVADTTQTGAVDSVQVKAGLASSDISLFQRGEDLVLSISGTTDTLAFASFYGPSEWGFKQVRFADGTVWSATELRARAVAVGGTVNGTTGNDSLVGTGGNDTLNGGDGHDVLRGEGGDDVLDGDVGFFVGATYGFGNDILLGGAGNDILRDAAGTNTFDGGAGNDSLYLGAGQDTVLFGRGSGVDFMSLDNNGSDLDIIQMGAGISSADVVIIRHYPDYHIVDLLIPDSGDKLTVTLSTNYPSVGLESTQAVVRFADGTEWNLAWSPPDLSFATGTQLDDLISGFPGDVLRGLAGNDTYSVGAGNGPIVELPGEGIDTVQSTVDYALPANVENLFLADNFTNVGPYADNATGNTLDNLIIGNTRDNILDGGAGNDVLVGGLFRSFEEFFLVGTGSDILIGGAGDDVLMADGGNVAFPADGSNGAWLFVGGGSDFLENPPREADDLLIGGIGNDTYILHSQQQTVAEFANEGTDTVRSTVDYVLGENVENLTLQENPVFFLPGPLVGTGNDLDNVLIGNSEDNVLSGGNGNDTLWGGSGIYRDSEIIRSGNDTLIGGTGHDTYLFKVGDGIDTIQDVSVLGEGNRIQFGIGIVQSDLTFTHDQTARTLTIQVGSSGTDQLLLVNFDPTGVNGSLVVETLAFADGSTANLASLLGGSVNDAPTVANPLADQTVQEDALFTIQVPGNAFADQDAGDVLTLSASLADGTALPSWMSFNAATHTFSGTPDDAQVGNLDLRVTATDTGNLSALDTFTLTVTNVNEAPTVAAPLANQTAVEDAVFTFVVPGSTFADVDSGDVLTYSGTLADGTALPTWLSFNSTTRTFSGIPLNSNVGTLALTVTATDSGNLSASDTFNLTITNVNEAPTVAHPIVDRSAPTGAAFTFTVPTNTFADVDLGDTLTYSATLANGSALPAWLSFNGTTQTFSGTPDSGDAGLVNIRVTATDSGSLSMSDLFDLTVTIQDQVLTGTAGSDLLAGGAGNDQLFGLAGNDTLQGGGGNDLLDGGTGTDTMQGGTGNDTYAVDVAGDVATELANEGTDTVQSSATYTLGSNVENLTLTGTANLNGTGNALDNILTGNSGTNLLTGGAGNDTYVVGAGDTVVESANGGTDTVQSAVVWTLSLNVENLTLMGTANINGTGSSANNALIGNSGNNALDGGSGKDTVDGGDGNDSLFGGSGDDTLLGGLGNDTLNAGSGNDVLNGGDGTDTLDGGSGDDQLFGGAGNDALTGGSGADQFTGGTGNDTMTGGSGNDLYNFSRGDGQDTIIDSDPFPGNQDRALFGATINPLDLVISRQANDLRLAIHGSADQITVQNWYTSSSNRIETIQAGNGELLVSAKVEQLIQAMASFTTFTGLTWDEGIDLRPQDVLTVLAASWQ